MVSIADTLQSYVVQIPKGEYRRNRLQLKETAISTTVPGIITNSVLAVYEAQLPNMQFRHTQIQLKYRPMHDLCMDQSVSRLKMCMVATSWSTPI